MWYICTDFPLIWGVKVVNLILISSPFSIGSNKNHTTFKIQRTKFKMKWYHSIDKMSTCMTLEDVILVPMWHSNSIVSSNVKVMCSITKIVNLIATVLNSTVVMVSKDPFLQKCRHLPKCYHHIYKKRLKVKHNFKTRKNIYFKKFPYLNFGMTLWLSASLADHNQKARGLYNAPPRW